MQEALHAIWNSCFIGAILLTITLILVGYLFTKHNIFINNPSQVLSSLVMKVALPCLAFVGFMSDFDVSQFGTFILSFIGFGILFLLGRLFYIKVNKEDFDLCRICFALGQVSLFGLPIAKAIYGQEALVSANMVLLSFRLYLYIYAYFLISNEKISKDSIKLTLKKTLLTPIMIVMGIGFIFYISQLFMPRVYLGEESVSILRVDKTLPHLYYVVENIGNLAIPLSMLLVGASLAKISTKDAIKSKLSWFNASLRSFVAPLIIFGLVCLYQFIFKGTSMELNRITCITFVLLFSSPVSVTVNTLVVEYKRNSVLTSNTILLSTLLTLVSAPIVVVLCELVF